LLADCCLLLSFSGEGRFEARVVTDTDGIRNASGYQLSVWNRASRWHQRCQWVNGNLGVSPFREQLAGKPLPAVNYASVVPRAKHKGAQKTKRG
jgi:hypothetical protein